MIDRKTLCELVIQVAETELLPRLNQIRAQTKPDGSLVTEADLAVQQALTQRLAEHWPEIGLLGEEMTEAEQQARLADPDQPVWCVDPLDGTSNFSSGIPYFCVSLGLLRGGRSELGIVYDPQRRECFSAVRGEGAWLNDQPLCTPTGPDALKQAIALVDFKRLPKPLAARIATDQPFRSQRNFGAVALEWCWLAAGRGQLYLHGGQKLWDFAAASVILAEAGGAGGVLESLDGEPLSDFRLGKFPAIAAANPALLRLWREWLRGSD